MYIDPKYVRIASDSDTTPWVCFQAPHIHGARYTKGPTKKAVPSVFDWVQ